MKATMTRSGPAAGSTAGPGAPARPPAGRSWRSFPRASTTPGEVRLTRAARLSRRLAEYR